MVEPGAADPPDRGMTVTQFLETALRRSPISAPCSTAPLEIIASMLATTVAATSGWPSHVLPEYQRSRSNTSATSVLATTPPTGRMQPFIPFPIGIMSGLGGRRAGS